MAPQCIVVSEVWEATYEEPIVLRKGERVSLGRRDAEWPGFVWCTGEEGDQGWIPLQILRLEGEASASAIAAYDARELTVSEGELVLAGQALAGWTWCEAADGGSGWVPDRCLALDG